MDRKSLITMLLVAGLVMMGYKFFFGSEPAGTVVPAPPTILALPEKVQPFIPQNGLAAPAVRTLGEARPAANGGKYKVGMEITNVNAGIQKVQLSEYAAEVGTPKAGEAFTPRMTLMSASDIALAPFATINVKIHYTNPGIVDEKLRDVVFGFDRGEMRYTGHFGTPQADDNVLTTWEFVDSKDPNEVRMRQYIGDSAKPDVEIFKVFRIKDAGGYEVEVSHEVVNRTPFPIEVTIDQAGPVNIPRDSVQADMRMFQAAAYSSNQSIKTDQAMVGQTTFTAGGGLFNSAAHLYPQELGSFTATTDPNWVTQADVLFSQDSRHIHLDKDPKAEADRILKLHTAANDLSWVAESNRFFAVIVRPTAGGLDPGRMPELANKRKIEQSTTFGIASADIVLPKGMPDWSSHPEKWVSGIALRGRPITVNGNMTAPQAVMTMRVFMGPKDRGLLTGDLLAAEGTPAHEFSLYSYLSVINFKRSGCTFMVFESVAIFILGTLDFIHNFTFHNYGIAIILLVVIVRLLLHPLTRYSQVSMAKMQKKMKSVQPELDRLKKKYGKEKTKYSEEMMKVYKENNINPAGQVLGCLPMLLQMPIWAALYSGLAVDIDLRHAGFIPGWIVDLSNPDTIIKFHEPVSVPLLSYLMGPLNGINLLPILLAGVFFAQQRMQQKTMPKPADETQAQTQMISQYMILLFPFFLYLAPSGLNLYIFASTAGGIFDTWLVRRRLRATGILPPVGAKTET